MPAAVAALTIDLGMESGARTASPEALSILSECLDAPWLTSVYLREQTNALNEPIPNFTVGRPLAEAAAEYVSCVLDLVEPGLTVN